MHTRRELPLSLDLLRGFEAAARHLSFTEAAEELFVTQSAVSRQVQTLEEQLGVKLFERRTRVLVLTRAGEAYYQEVSKALQQLREATARIRSGIDPLVRVTTTITFASLWLVPRLTHFQSRFAQIPVHVIAQNILLDLERDAADVAVRYTTADKAGEGAVMLFGETVAPVCSPSLIRNRKRVQNANELLRLPLLHYEDTQAASPWLSWDAWLEAVGLEYPKDARSLTFSHYDQLIRAAMAGQGVALGRFPLMNELVHDGRLVMPLRSLPAPLAQGRGYWLVVPSHSAERPQVQIFVEWIRSEASAALQAQQPKGQHKR